VSGHIISIGGIILGIHFRWLLKAPEMTDRDALLAAVFENPKDDTARLVLADHLRETDDPDSLALGRFLWAGVTASWFDKVSAWKSQLCITAMCEIGSLVDYPAKWLSRLGLGPTLVTTDGWTREVMLDRVAVGIDEFQGVYSRGMLSELSLPLRKWYEIGSAALARWPLKYVRITDDPGLIFTIDHTPHGWGLICSFGEYSQTQRLHSNRQSLMEWVVLDCKRLISMMGRQIDRAMTKVPPAQPGFPITMAQSRSSSAVPGGR
jgi:uncharacterized protein (TIGR02996 family)